MTVAANSEASIQTIKSIDDQCIAAALGTAPGRVRLDHSSPGAAGKSVVVNLRGTTVKTTAERIAEYQAKRAANAGRMQSIMEKSNEDGSTLDESQREEYDTLTQEIKGIDEHLTRLKQLEQVMIGTATPVEAKTVDSPQSGAEVRGGSIISVKRNVPPGTAFARYAQALANSKGVLIQALEFARNNERWKDTPEVELFLKTAVTSGSTTSTTWAGPLVVAQTMVSEFVDMLRPQTIVGKLTGSLRRVPFNIRVASQSTGSTVGWVGQGSPKPVSELVFAEQSLGWAKAAGIVVISQELARFSDPSAEAVIRQDLIDTMSVFMDAQFIDPSVAAVAERESASITNGLTAVTATGSTVAPHHRRYQQPAGELHQQRHAPKSPFWIMHPITALGLSLKRTLAGCLRFPRHHAERRDLLWHSGHHQPLGAEDHVGRFDHRAAGRERGVLRRRRPGDLDEQRGLECSQQTAPTAGRNRWCLMAKITWLAYGRSASWTGRAAWHRCHYLDQVPVY